MTPQQKMQQRILEAEEATPQVAPAILSTKPAEPLPQVDLDHEKFVELFHALMPNKRPTLQQDYENYVKASQSLRAIVFDITVMFEPGPLVERLQRLFLPPPRRWFICPNCGGGGTGDIGYCRFCGGHGYKIYM